ncbi:hypothetical protein SUNI508_07598 [Seiridium unicorne]|uniref:Uncharacterized protein n=1 Tax=Seiridium unicorne TaxID=138068 RepID=A0ABR2UX26_9PEZI
MACALETFIVALQGRDARPEKWILKKRTMGGAPLLPGFFENGRVSFDSPADVPLVFPKRPTRRLFRRLPTVSDSRWRNLLWYALLVGDLWRWLGSGHSFKIFG